MRQRARTGSLLALLFAALLLSGCAAGSPAVVVPESPDTVAEAPEFAEAPAPTAIPEPTATPESAAAVMEMEQAQAADAVAPEPALTAESPGEMASSETTTQPLAASSPATSDSAAFAQEVALTPEPPPVTADNGATSAEAISPEPDVAFVEEAVAAPADSLARPAPPPDPGTGMSEMVQGGSNGRLEVALTFDAGADTGYGAEILDLLRDEGIPATFGMTGVYAEMNPDLVRRMVAEGHQLINHTWDHPSLTGANTGMPPLTAEQVAAQLWDTENLVREVTGGYQMQPYFRPPYGDYDAASLGYLYDNGFYLSIWWTCDSHGWAEWSAQEIIDYCTTNIVEDEILLMHVGASAKGDYEALPGLIQFFRSNGYAFVTVEQMLQP